MCMREEPALNLVLDKSLSTTRVASKERVATPIAFVKQLMSDSGWCSMRRPLRACNLPKAHRPRCLVHEQRLSFGSPLLGTAYLR